MEEVRLRLKPKAKEDRIDDLFTRTLTWLETVPSKLI